MVKDFLDVGNIFKVDDEIGFIGLERFDLELCLAYFVIVEYLLGGEFWGWLRIR